MKYTIKEWCATCGKAKQYSGITSEDGQPTPPEMCGCVDTVSVRPVNSAPPTTIDYTSFISSPAYIMARLIPEQMQELEKMIRRVVSEELTKMFPGDGE